MNFEIKWGRMESLLKRRFTSEQSAQSPIFYFEDNSFIYLYIAKSIYIVMSSASTDEMDLKAFKMEFLKDAEELVSKPKQTSLVIRQE